MNDFIKDYTVSLFKRYHPFLLYNYKDDINQEVELIRCMVSSITDEFQLRKFINSKVVEFSRSYGHYYYNAFKGRLLITEHEINDFNIKTVYTNTILPDTVDCNKLSNTISCRISKLRQEKGITIHKLHTISGISPHTIKALENNERNIDLRILFNICHIFNVSIHSILLNRFSPALCRSWIMYSNILVKRLLMLLSLEKNPQLLLIHNNISPSTITKLKHGGSTNLSIIVKLVNCLRITPHFLLREVKEGGFIKC